MISRRINRFGLARLAFVVLAAFTSHAQTFTVLHSFDMSDGWEPSAGLSMDQRGNLYGTTSAGGPGNGCGQGGGCGTVFQMQRVGSGWVFHLLYTFEGPDGVGPLSRVIFGRDGALYGTTQYGGTQGYGVVFRLSPPPTVCRSVSCPWRETVLHSFGVGTDGARPCYGDLTFDHAGNIFGTTWAGGSFGFGTVYEVSQSTGGWTESVIYSFQGGNDGQGPCAGVTLDNAGNLYGTTIYGGGNGCAPQPGCGTIYRLAPSASGWTESILYNLGDSESAGSEPVGGLVFDSLGNLYGITNNGGGVYELTPSGSGWSFSVIYFFATLGAYDSLTMDSTGNLYGTLEYGNPEVFRLTQTGGQWMLTGFSGSAGEGPTGSVILDAEGNLYTTAGTGGANDYGVVFEVTP